MSRVAHWGTFEVANTGDLLFPLVLARHLPESTVRLLGPLGGTAPMGLGQPVERITPFDDPDFWQQAQDVDAFVLGGGELAHPGSALVRTEAGLQRIDYWPFVADLGLLAQVRPVAWNGVGVPIDLPDALAPLLRFALEQVDLLAVRDEASRSRLLAAGVEREVAVTPDTGILAGDVFGEPQREAATASLRAAGTLAPRSHRPLVVAHLSILTPTVAAEAATALRLVRDAGRDLVLLAVGPTHGDGQALRELATAIGGAVTVVDEPTVLDVVAVLEEADVVVATSYHAVLVATALGTPAALVQHGAHRPSKQQSLVDQLGRQKWLLDRPDRVPEAVDALLDGAGEPDSGAVQALQAKARRHLEQVADVTRTVRPQHDLAERTAAHRAGLHQLRAVAATAAALRTDVVLLQDQLGRAVARAHEVEAAFWRAADLTGGRTATASQVLDLDVVRSAELQTAPYRWGHIGPLFAPDTARELASTFPDADADDRYGDDGRRQWRYRVRSLVAMGATTATTPSGLQPVWRSLAEVLASQDYRDAISSLTGVDLTDHELEANAFAYPVGSFQDPHPDLPEKVVTHVLWFNETWRSEHGGCLRILRSKDPADVAHELLPLLGWSAVFVRSDDSWHAVPEVVAGAPADRRAVVATFHLPGSRSSMWP
jgi:polysaccharide pyruvyl transferase WcaK-like protein